MDTAADAPSPLPAGFYCPDCGYDLRGLSSPQCPECGQALALLRATESQLPWVHRGQVGAVRAYLRTVWLVVRRPRRLAAEAARPVSYADAQAFRWVTVTIAFGALALGGLCGWLGAPDLLEDLEGIEWMLIPIAVGLLAALAAMTGLPSYLMHPRWAPLAMQNRAIALSFYACAPLALLPLALLAAGPFAVQAFMMRRAGVVAESAVPAGAVAVVTAALLLLWWVGLVKLAGRVLHRPRRTVAVALLVPLLWVIVGTLLAVGLPLLTFAVAVVIYSLR